MLGYLDDSSRLSGKYFGKYNLLWEVLGGLFEKNVFNE